MSSLRVRLNRLEARPRERRYAEGLLDDVARFTAEVGSRPPRPYQVTVAEAILDSVRGRIDVIEAYRFP